MRSDVESLGPKDITELSSVVPRLSNDYEHLRAGASQQSSMGRSMRGSLGRNNAARRELDGEVRIFYVRLANELNDLAMLEIPINLLYDRHDPPVKEKKEPIDTRSAEQKETSALFAFNDPRLQHLKVNYTREHLQPENVNFAANPEAYRAALDEIIKYNQYVNEYNFVQEFHARMTATLVNKKPENVTKQDYVNLFIKYDTNTDDLISKHELLQMMHDCDMKYVTLAEAQFVFNMIARFKSTMNV